MNDADTPLAALDVALASAPEPASPSPASTPPAGSTPPIAPPWRLEAALDPAHLQHGQRAPLLLLAFGSDADDVARRLAGDRLKSVYRELHDVAARAVVENLALQRHGKLAVQLKRAAAALDEATFNVGHSRQRMRDVLADGEGEADADTYERRLSEALADQAALEMRVAILKEHLHRADIAATESLQKTIHAAAREQQRAVRAELAQVEQMIGEAAAALVGRLFSLQETVARLPSWDDICRMADVAREERTEDRGQRTEAEAAPADGVDPSEDGTPPDEVAPAGGVDPGCDAAPDAESAVEPRGAAVDDLVRFLREECEIGPGFEVRAGDLQERWTLWCHGQQIDPHGEAWLGRELRQQVEGLQRSQPRKDGPDGPARPVVYLGVSLKDEG